MCDGLYVSSGHCWQVPSVASVGGVARKLPAPHVATVWGEHTAPRRKYPTRQRPHVCLLVLDPSLTRICPAPLHTTFSCSKHSVSLFVSSLYLTTQS